MPPGNRSKRGSRGRTRGGHSGGPNPNKAAKGSGDKPTPTAADNEPASKQITDKSLKPTANVHHANEDEDPPAVCWICAEPVKYYSLFACNHRTCHVCALRLRVLYNKFECAFCKEPQPTVIFTTSPDADFLSYTPHAIPHKDTKLSIFFETRDMMEETRILLQFNCPALECDYIASGWDDLRCHTRIVHGKMLCDLCIQYKKVFAHEHALYPPNMLPLHLPSIPHQPRKLPLNETIECGIHPLCKFCNECFFGDDELFVHMRERHEECFLCKRNEIRDQYFQNYDSLELHFSQIHFACTDPICETQAFVVFNSELDLNAHRLEAHGTDMNLKDKKQARRVQVESEVDNIGSGSRRGGQACAVRERERQPMPRVVQTRGSVARDAVAKYLMAESTPSGRAASVTAAIPGYRTNESGAHKLISTVCNVLDQNLHDTASIVNAVVDFLEEDEKKHDLLAAWNEFKNSSEQRHQSLHLVTATTASGYAGTSNGCVLNTVNGKAPWYSQQSPRPDHHAVRIASPPSSSSRTVPSASVSTLTSSESAQREAFIHPPTNANVTSGSHQSQQTKSWASVAALSSLSSATISKKTDGAHQPLLSSTAQDQQSPSSTGPSTGANVALGFSYDCPYRSQPPRTWASLARSALAPNWNIHGGEDGLETPTFAPVSEWSEVTVGQGKKGKGKQRQRLT